jgi:hypothetical protein
MQVEEVAVAEALLKLMEQHPLDLVAVAEDGILVAGKQLDILEQMDLAEAAAVELELLDQYQYQVAQVASEVAE